MGFIPFTRETLSMFPKRTPTVDGQHFAPLGNIGKPLFVGIYRGIDSFLALFWVVRNGFRNQPQCGVRTGHSPSRQAYKSLQKRLTRSANTQHRALREARGAALVLPSLRSRVLSDTQLFSGTLFLFFGGCPTKNGLPEEGFTFFLGSLNN